MKRDEKRAAKAKINPAVNLVKLYPITGLVDFRRTFLLLCAAIIAASFAAVINVAPQVIGLSPVNAEWLKGGARVAAFILAGCWLVRFIYEACRRQSLYYGIEDGNLVISRGIILKQRGFFPLSRITDIYLERSALDFLFGLHTLHVSTPTSLSERFARIEGLNLPMALALQRQLATMIEGGMEKDNLPNFSRHYDQASPLTRISFAAASA